MRSKAPTQRSRDDLLRRLVIKDYSFRPKQQAYAEMTRVGLWDSERAILEKYFGHSAGAKGGRRILDLGCGTGRVSFPLAKMGHDVIGVDLVPGMIRRARELAKGMPVGKGTVRFLVGDALDLHLEDGSFDGAVFSFNGWDQIPGRENRQKALREVSRVLKPGAYFVFTTFLRRDNALNFMLSASYSRAILEEIVGVGKGGSAEFGDVLVTRGRIPHIPEGQYIHVPSKRTVLAQIRAAGMKVVFCGWKDERWPRDRRFGVGDTMFFVCRKPTEKKQGFNEGISSSCRQRHMLRIRQAKPL